MVKVKRVYETPSRDDGARVIVDRLWPRGIAKVAASIELWLRDAAPSNELRTWFAHDPVRWPEFKRRYFRELRTNGEALNLLRGKMRAGDVTLLYSARDQQHNNAVALAEFVKRTSRKTNWRKARTGRTD